MTARILAHRSTADRSGLVHELTLRQVEVIRAVTLAGTIQGAADLLGVTPPGVSRLVKHTETVLGLRLFDRRGGLFAPSPEARSVFDMLHQVHRQMENLNSAVLNLRRGEDVRLAFACAPSIAQFIAARAVRDLRDRFPDLYIDLNILKIEEAADYLLLEQGEFVIMSSPLTSPALESRALARARLLVILPDDHPLAARAVISVHDLMGEPFVGVDPDDPYGRALAQPFRDAGLELPHTVRGRFAQTVLSLVRHGLGVAVIDEFSVAEAALPGIVRRPLAEPGAITAHVVTKRGRDLSSFAETAITMFRRGLIRATDGATGRGGAAL